jgi:hypothetical protein
MIPSPTKPTLSGIRPAFGDGCAHVPLDPAFQGVLAQHEAVSLGLQAQVVERAVFGQAEQALGGLCPVDHQLYPAPVHLVGALS